MTEFKTFSAEYGGKQIATAVCGIHHYPYGTSTLVLYELFVVPEYRRQGIGSTLLNQVKAFAQEHNTDLIELVMEGSNDAAKLYEKAGFKHRKEISIYTLDMKMKKV
jgi:ribosomal protein S18 acetylase RimI-like enzyme